MFCRFKSCQKCGGDLVWDGEEWRCWQCGQHYYPAPSLAEIPAVSPDPKSLPATVEWSERPRRQRGRHGQRAVRNVNSLIVAKDRSDERWWEKNQEIIRYLDEGRPIREIAALVGRGERQVRVVRERLSDLRASKEAEHST